MKITKILASMVVVGILAASSANALSLAWGADWVYSYDSDTMAFDEALYDAGVSESGVAWLVVMSSSDLTGYAVDTDGNLVTGANFVQAFSANVNDGHSVGGVASGDNVTLGNYYALVVYDPVEGLYGVSAQTVLGSDTGMLVGPPPTAGTWSGIYNNETTPGNYEGGDNAPYMRADLAPVPEPTSMALIGIGAAVVALRKRFGKKV